MPVTVVRLTRSRGAAGEVVARLGVPLLDEYLEFLAGRCRPNTVLAVAYDLKVFTSFQLANQNDLFPSQTNPFLSPVLGKNTIVFQDLQIQTGLRPRLFEHFRSRGLHDVRGEIIGPAVDERTLVGSADRGAGGGHDHGFRHEHGLLRDDPGREVRPSSSVSHRRGRRT